MATLAIVPHHWHGEQAVAASLRQEPFRFQFLQAVRILETIRSRMEAEITGTHVPGTPTERDPGIRFRSRVSFAFPASEVDAIRLSAAGDPVPVAEMTINFLGLAGALGPLPQAYTEMILEAATRRDMAAVDFLDIFNHRLVWLLYRAHKAHHVTLTVEPPYRGEPAQYLFALIGLGQKTLRDRLRVPDSALLHYSGLLARNVRTATALERILSDYFGVHARVHQFVGTWRHLDPSQWTRIGKEATLGAGAVLGRRAWDQAGGVLLELGPLNIAQFQRFLPGASAHAHLSELARFYLGPTRRIQVRLQLKQAEIPVASLDSARLGYTSWIGKAQQHGSNGAVNFFLED
jgi:type VI secretion system protein ImpH